MRRISWQPDIPDFFLHVVEALGHVVDGLVVLVVVLLYARLARVKLALLGHVGQGVVQLTKGRQQPGPVGPHLAVLTAQAELHGEPVQLQRAQDIMGMFYIRHWIVVELQGEPVQLYRAEDIVREDVNIHNCWLQPKCCSIKEQCIAFPIYVGCSWLLNGGCSQLILTSPLTT